MNKAQLQEKLQYFIQDGETVSVEMYLQYEDDNKSILTYLPATEENKLSPALGRIVRSQIKNKFFNESEDYQYEIVSANTAEANNVRQVFHISKADIPRASVIFDAVVNNKAGEFPNNLELERVWSYIFKVDCLNATIYLFKKNYQISVLKKESSYALLFSNNKLSLLDKDLLRLSKHFDVMLIEEELIILNRSEFEKAFDYVGAMKAAAEVNIDVIKNSKLVDGMDIISMLSNKKNTLRKLLNINPLSKILTKTPKQIVNLAKKYKVEFKMTDDEAKLSITTKKSAVAFVEMLNDDYLKSEFSGSLYKIKGKSEIGATNKTIAKNAI
ncbi:MAG: DUF4868 domain-containing protein [Bacteroidetes bacterium]|nr:DUF4868 domain-containing protein [Bacteroidota bacterium]